MQDKIIAAIAAYLEGNNLELFQKIYANRVHSKFVQGQIDYYKLPPNQWPDDCVAIKSRREDIDFHNKQSDELIQAIATEIAAAIAPLVEAGEPDWKDAPEWANWVAQDENGSWFWYENKPNKDLSTWFDKTNGNFCSVDFPSDSWENSLQERPK